MIEFILCFLLCFPVYSLIPLMILTSDEPRIRFNNELCGWYMVVVAFPFDKTIPAYKLHGSEDNP